MKHSESGAFTKKRLSTHLWIASILTFTTLTAIAPQAKAETYSPAPETAQTFWTPAARLDTGKPQRITLDNQTGLTLEYIVTTHTNFRTIQPGQSVTLSDIATPLFVNINSQDSDDHVKYNVAVDEKTNTLIVTIQRTNGKDNHTLNINETGAVYLY